MYTKDVEVNGHPRHIQIDDTAGQVRLILTDSSVPAPAGAADNLPARVYGRWILLAAPKDIFYFFTGSVSRSA